ncbi:MAG: amino acid ABC transporter permease [Pseudolabrys sp.]
MLRLRDAFSLPLVSASEGALRTWRRTERAGLAVLLTIFVCSSAYAATVVSGHDSIPTVLWRWAPLLLWGFVFNLIISALSMALGTVAGVPLGIFQMSPNPLISRPAILVTQFFRNAPWLVLLFICVLLLPFELRIGTLRIPFPDWVKAVVGFALPAMANVAEIVRGAVLSVPSGQWESAESLCFSRRQTMMQIILPQCIKRMLPPWMNLYSLITMSSVNASVVGVTEMLTITTQVHAAEGSRPELLAPLYSFALVCFFIYSYPISKWTEYLELKYQVKE